MDQLAAYDGRVQKCPDPFSDGKKPLGFVKLGEKRYLLYSIGPDGVDDKGVLRLAADFNFNAFRFPWQVMFFGESLRSAVMPKDSWRGDIVEERDVTPLPPAKGKK